MKNPVRLQRKKTKKLKVTSPNGLFNFFVSRSRSNFFCNPYKIGSILSINEEKKIVCVIYI
jgi:hypothetical protein